jgi:hypothetical protein
MDAINKPYRLHDGSPLTELEADEFFKNAARNVAIHGARMANGWSLTPEEDDNLRLNAEDAASLAIQLDGDLFEAPVAFAKEQEDYIDKLKAFETAAYALSESWIALEMAGGQTSNELYPFDRSFDEVCVEITLFREQSEKGSR